MKLSNLTSHLPAQATLSKIPATRTHRSVAEYASVLSIGLIAGASLALLLTPTPGNTTVQPVPVGTCTIWACAAASASKAHASIVDFFR